MKLRPDGQEPFQAPPEYGRSLTSLTLNLLSADLELARRFHVEVLGVDVRYVDPDLLVAEGFDTSWMVHADHTYDKHPLLARTATADGRGSGVEIRLHGADPDAMADRAKTAGFDILDGPRDQPDHGLREAHIVDGDGYVWVPDRSLPSDS